jgi:sulfate/thiosulfate transport system ATP-binding protein
MGIEVRNVSKTFGAITVVNDVSFKVGGGELFALLGPSGCGKTTLLRIIAGLEVPDSGSVLLEGEDATGWNARDRAVGFVFQHYALFRHMTVFENVAFGLRVRPRNRRPSEESISRTVHELLTLVQLDYLADRYPSQLSGGQRQRVALARALAVQPKVLLLDEPFGALDASVRRELRRWLRQLHEEIRLTSVFVTHDQEEAFELADRVVIMNHGKVEQEGASHEVLEDPATPFVMGFLGDVNRFHGRVQAGKGLFGPLTIDHPSGVEQDDGVARPASAYARPHELTLGRTESGGGLWATVQHVNIAGALVKLELKTKDGDQPMRLELPREEHQRLDVQPGERVYVTPRKLRVFVGEE